MTLIKSILLADDDADDANLFLEALNSIDSSIRCEHAANGNDALNFLTNPLNEKPQIIILDLNMPVMTGWDCLQILKKNKILKNIPVVIYSTSTYQGDQEKALDLGALCFITKPHRFTVLKSILSVLLTSPIDTWASALKKFNNVAFDPRKVTSL